MGLSKLHDPEQGQMRVAGLMSGSGTNLRKIIEREKELDKEKGKSPYKVVVIFTDTAESNAVQIGKDFDIPVVVHDLKGFCAARGVKRRDMEARAQFDRENAAALKTYGATVAAYAGYMSIATAPLVEAFLGVNVHPADLSIEENGERKYVGPAHVPSQNAIIAGEKTLCSTTHIIEPKLDAGRILMRSPGLPVELPTDFDPKNETRLTEIAKAHQERLKEAGDWVVFPKTLEYLAEGRFSQDENGTLHFDEKPTPNGKEIKR